MQAEAAENTPPSPSDSCSLIMIREVEWFECTSACREPVGPLCPALVTFSLYFITGNRCMPATKPRVPYMLQLLEKLSCGHVFTHRFSLMLWICKCTSRNHGGRKRNQMLCLDAKAFYTHRWVDLWLQSSILPTPLEPTGQFEVV